MKRSLADVVAAVLGPVFAFLHFIGVGWADRLHRAAERRSPGVRVVVGMMVCAIYATGLVLAVALMEIGLARVPSDLAMFVRGLVLGAALAYTESALWNMRRAAWTREAA